MLIPHKCVIRMQRIPTSVLSLQMPCKTKHHEIKFNYFFISLNLESIVINILCRAWAKNIVHKINGVNKGSVHFELMID